MAKKTKTRSKQAKLDHDEAARVLMAALMSPRNKRAAENHPVVGPLIKRLGPKGMATLSDIAENQKLTDCSKPYER